MWRGDCQTVDDRGHRGPAVQFGLRKCIAHGAVDHAHQAGPADKDQLGHGIGFYLCLRRQIGRNLRDLCRHLRQTRRHHRRWQWDRQPALHDLEVDLRRCAGIGVIRRDLAGLYREGHIVAQLILQHPLQSVQQLRLHRVFRQILDRATLFAGVKERDFLPRRQIGKNRMRGGVGFIPEHMFDLAAHPQMRHHMLKAQLAVKVGPANAHPFAGEDMNTRVTFLPEKGKVRRTAPDIDDQPQIAGF